MNRFYAIYWRVIFCNAIQTAVLADYAVKQPLTLKVDFMRLAAVRALVNQANLCSVWRP